MKTIRKGVDFVNNAGQKVDCANYGNCCYNTGGRCCQSGK